MSAVPRPSVGVVGDAANRGFPTNVGIVAMEIYVPKTCISQEALEVHDGASTGKYTIGLGQTKMAFTTDKEDINSIALTVVKNLIEKYGIDPRDVGRLEVGTETIIDKSKAVKTVLMSIFNEAGNYSVEGVDTHNACYGGTNAFFNTLNWMESSAWDGRYGIVVAADNAVYAPGNARPTGGCGAVAMLIGPNAPLVVERGLRSTYMAHTWDFFKPNMGSEYPTVNGKLTVSSYLSAVDGCYQQYAAKFEQLNPGAKFDANTFDYNCFHTPYNKLVMKSFGRFFFNDFLRDSTRPEFASEEIQGLKEMPIDKTYEDKTVEKCFLAVSKSSYESKVLPSTMMSKECGNCYTASLYGGLASLVSNTPFSELSGKRVSMFSYGSGLASSLFSILVRGDTTHIASVINMSARLAARDVCDCAVYTATLKHREETFKQVPFTPSGELPLFPGTYYLQGIDDKYVRTYARTA